MTTASLQLLGEFDLHLDGERVQLPPGGERMVAFLALRRQAQTRGTVAGAVWPGASAIRGLVHLESLLRRLPRSLDHHLVVDAGGRIGLDGTWTIDLDQALDAARRLHVDATPQGRDLAVFRRDLLPCWSDPWLPDLQDRYRRLRLSVLQRLGRHQLEVGELDDAVDIAVELIAEDGLREDAHHLLVAALVQRGDLDMARRTVDRFRARLRHELGVEPSSQMTELVARLHHPAGEDRCA